MLFQRQYTASYTALCDFQSHDLLQTAHFKNQIMKYNFKELKFDQHREHSFLQLCINWMFNFEQFKNFCGYGSWKPIISTTIDGGNILNIGFFI